MTTDDRDKIPTDPIEPLEVVAVARTRTERTAATIIIDLADEEMAAEFLEFIAAAVRKRARLRITVE